MAQMKRNDEKGMESRNRSRQIRPIKGGEVGALQLLIFC
jgi:hypothetical protein